MKAKMFLRQRSHNKVWYGIVICEYNQMNSHDFAVRKFTRPRLFVQEHLDQKLPLQSKTKGNISYIVSVLKEVTKESRASGFQS